MALHRTSTRTHPTSRDRFDVSRSFDQRVKVYVNMSMCTLWFEFSESTLTLVNIELTTPLRVRGILLLIRVLRSNECRL